jgi:hypothetical protein
MSVGLFEFLAADETQARLASRRALVLAQNRIETRLGAFLGSSKSPKEYDARFEMVADDFVGIVSVACKEVGHDNSTAIAKSLHSFFRSGCNCDDNVENDDRDDIEDAKKEGDSDEKTSRTSCSKCSCDLDDDGHCDNCGNKESSDDDEKTSSIGGEAVSPLVQAAKNNPSDQDPQKATGPTVLDALETDEFERPRTIPAIKIQDEDDEKKESRFRWAADGDNTGLGGPEPVIDKNKGTVPKYKEESKRWPVIEKDPIEVIKATNDSPLKEIGEKVTEKENLPTATGLDDSGFSDGGVNKGPHTDQWNNDGQTDPVQSESMEV